MRSGNYVACLGSHSEVTGREEGWGRGEEEREKGPGFCFYWGRG